MNIIDFIKGNGIKGAIFDMDGTLTDSMEAWSEIYSVLFGYFGVEFNGEFVNQVNHIPMRNRVKVIIDEYSLNADLEKAYNFWLKKAVVYYKKIFKIKPYMLEALKTLKSCGVKIAVATASDKRCAQEFIKSNNLTGYISSVTELVEVQRDKSFPDIYFKAAEKLGLKPDACMVFEDALTAIKSAQSGGFKVCGVQDGFSENDEEKITNVSDLTLGFTEKIYDKRNTKIIAHRGLSGIYTENTVKAFEEACKRSYCGTECDVHITADGKYIIFHDDSTGRLCEEDVIIERTPFKRLRALKFKDGVSRMPTLEEYLGVVARFNKTAVIELKNAMPKNNIREIIEICKKAYKLDNIVIISFNFENLVTVRKILPVQQIQFLTGNTDDVLIDKLKKYNFGLDICFNSLTKDIVERLHKYGITVNCWTCDDRDKAISLANFGVDLITSDILE